MSKKNIVLLISNNQEYIRHAEREEKKYGAQMNSIYEAISNIYIPLLNMFAALEKDRVPFRISLVFPPVFCTLLRDPIIQQQYIEWLDRRIALGKHELERCSDNAELSNVIKFYLEKAHEDKFNFTVNYEQDILCKFLEYQKKGNVELLATCATNIFLPHYADMHEVLNAQVETGLYAHRTFFNEPPAGFWLPEMGYMPGIEKVLAAYGVKYTVLDARAFLFSEDEVEKGIFTPVQCNADVSAFARDNRIDDEVFGENGYASSPIYCDVNRDIAFDLPPHELAPLFANGSARYASGYCYYNKTAGRENCYSPEAAMEQCARDAELFIHAKADLLEKASSCIPNSKEVSLVCTFYAEQFMRNWSEGIAWIEQLFRHAEDSTVSFSLFNELLAGKPCLQHIRPYYSATNGWGYGETLCAKKNDWIMSHVRKASERMVDLAERFPDDTGLKARLLNVGARELMLAQSCGWADMIWKGQFPEYAEERFKESIAAFTTVFDSLGSNTVSTEWLTECETRHPVFPWINYRIFSRKKNILL